MAPFLDSYELVPLSQVSPQYWRVAGVLAVLGHSPTDCDRVAIGELSSAFVPQEWDDRRFASDLGPDPRSRAQRRREELEKRAALKRYRKRMARGAASRR